MSLSMKEWFFKSVSIAFIEKGRLREGVGKESEGRKWWCFPFKSIHYWKILVWTQCERVLSFNFLSFIFILHLLQFKWKESYFFLHPLFPSISSYLNITLIIGWDKFINVHLNKERRKWSVRWVFCLNLSIKGNICVS